MKLKDQLNHIHDEFRLYRVDEGVGLIRPSLSYEEKRVMRIRDTGYSVNDLMSADFNVYFLNQDSCALRVNEEQVKSAGFGSQKSAVGKSVFDMVPVIPKLIANSVRQNDLTVMKTKKLHLLEEEHIDLKNITCYRYITIKLPWFDSERKIIGIFGCSIEVSHHSLAKSLQQIINMGIFSSINPPTNIPLPGFIHSNHYLSKREIQILEHLVRCKTARQIGSILNISARTVEVHLMNIKQKMGVSSKAELIDKVIDHFI